MLMMYPSVTKETLAELIMRIDYISWADGQFHGVKSDFYTQLVGVLQDVYFANYKVMANNIETITRLKAEGWLEAGFEFQTNADTDGYKHACNRIETCLLHAFTWNEVKIRDNIGGMHLWSLIHDWFGWLGEGRTCNLPSKCVPNLIDFQNASPYKLLIDGKGKATSPIHVIKLGGAKRAVPAFTAPLTTEPSQEPYNKRFTKRLRKLGWVRLGSGLYSEVYGHDAYPYVIKVSRSHDGGLSYAKWILDNGIDSPYAPKIYSLRITEDCYIVVMKRYDATLGHISREDDGESIADDYQSAAKWIKGSYHQVYGQPDTKLEMAIFNAATDVIDTKFPGLMDYMAHLRTDLEVDGFDDHNGNVMVDYATNTIVITDPIAGGDDHYTGPKNIRIRANTTPIKLAA